MWDSLFLRDMGEKSTLVDFLPCIKKITESISTIINLSFMVGDSIWVEVNF